MLWRLVQHFDELICDAVTATLETLPDLAAGPSMPASVTVEKSGGVVLVHCNGDWTITGVQAVDEEMRTLAESDFKSITIDTSSVSNFDTAGAWIVERLRRACDSETQTFTHIDAKDSRRKLVRVVQPHRRFEQSRRGLLSTIKTSFVEKLGRFMVSLGDDFIMMANMIGAAIRGPQMKAGKRGGIRLISIVNQLDHMAVRAIPVITVMAFLIGAIIAQQGAFQLKFFGEELLTVNLVGILLLREIGVLLTAIMVAGRTGSAITAEIGTMKMREEIDALRVIGLNPVGVLIFPRIIALIIALPILTLLADLAGLAGGMVVTWVYVGITPGQFLEALRGAIDYSTFFAGLIKAPFMAIVIALVSAVEGLKVKGSAESLGQRTTSAVVRSIFAVILMDGCFAIFYAAIDY